MGIRLVESIKVSYCGGRPWDMGLSHTAVLFDGEQFAVDCHCQPDGPHFDWAELQPEPFMLAVLAGWYGPPREGDLVEALSGEMACDGYIAEPVA